MENIGKGTLAKTKNKKEYQSKSEKRFGKAICMKGNIYPHKEGYQVRFGREISKWFKYRDQAERFLIGIRYETDKGTFDPRDHHKSKPLAFDKLAKKYLEKKIKKVGRKHYNNLRNYMNRAKSIWQDNNIKAIGFAEIEDLLDAQDDISDTTKAKMKSCLHDFWTWLLRRRVITRDQFPEFPTVKFELGWRNITDIETQQKILAEVKNISYHKNPKIWLGIKMLATYPSVRPGELISIKEKHINLKNGTIVIPHPKDKKPKILFLLDDDIDLLKKMPRGMPHLYFFRHNSRVKGCKPGIKFGDRYFYKKWKKACENLGIKNIDLYGGTRHTTVTALGQYLTPEQIKHGTGHATNRAFDRYFQREARDAIQVYQTIKDLQHTYKSKLKLN